MRTAANRSEEYRRYIGQVLSLDEAHVRTFDHKQCLAIIDSMYEGGVEAFNREVLGISLEQQSQSTQAQLKRDFIRQLGRYFPIQAHEQIVDFKFDTERRLASLSIEGYVVRESFAREVLTARYLRVYMFRGSNYALDPTLTMTVQDPDFTPEVYCGQYAVVNSPERFKDKLFQYLDCAKPGTRRTPLDSPGHDSRVRQDNQLIFQMLNLEVATSSEIFGEE